MTEKDEKRVQLETELLMARSAASAKGVDKRAELDALIAEYGGAENVPHEKLEEYLGQMDEVAKMIRLTSSLQDLSGRFNLPFPHSKTGIALSLFVNARLTDPELYETVEQLHNGSDENVRPNLVKLMLRLGDLTQAQIDAKADTPEEKARWTRWLDSNPFEVRGFEDTPKKKE